MVNLGSDEIIKYPFLDEAGKYLSDKGFSLEDFATNADLKKIVESAFERITTAIDGRIYKSDLATNNSSTTNEIFSFLIAVILLKLSGMNTLTRRFSLAEARRAEKFLENDLKNQQNAGNARLSLQILQELFSVTIQKEDEYFTIPISDYLKHSVNFHEREWKLINRHVENGKVFLSPDKTVRLIRKELGNYISSKIINAPKPSMIPGLEKIVDELISISKKLTPTYTITTGEYPPCIKHAIDVLEKGENLPHSGRFMLATFLLSRGQTVQQIAPLFKNAPDYNPRVTLYQLNHLAGTSGSSTTYACPSCEKLKTQDLCFITKECDNIINPSQFGKKRK